MRGKAAAMLKGENKLAKSKKQKAVEGVKPVDGKMKCPACRKEYETDEQISNKEVMSYKLPYLCAAHGEQWTAAWEKEEAKENKNEGMASAPAATSETINAVQPETAQLEEAKEKEVTTKVKGLKVKQKSKKTSAKNVSLLSRGKKKAVAIAAKTKKAAAATQVAVKREKWAMLPVPGMKSKLSRVHIERIDKALTVAGELFKKQEQVTWQDAAAALAKKGEKISDREIRFAMTCAAARGDLKRVARGVYAQK